MLQDTTTHHTLTSKFSLNVVDLTLINLATEDDKARKRDIWAKFFKATTWEELYMLAEQNPVIEKSVVIIKQLTEEERLKQYYEAREDQIRRQRGTENRIAKVTTELSNTKTELNNTKAELSNTKTELDDAKTKLSDAESRIKALEAEIKRLSSNE